MAAERPPLTRHIRQRLSAYRLAQPGGDHTVAGSPPPSARTSPAAVLIAILSRPTGATVLLTRRSDTLTHHRGQISLPGGRTDSGDHDATATALREAFEETGLPPAAVELLGHLPDYRTVTNFLVSPVVGYVNDPPPLTPNPAEVAEAFEVPLEFIADPRNYQRHSRLHQGKPRPYHALPYQRHYIWGATAAILVSFRTALAAPA